MKRRASCFFVLCLALLPRVSKAEPDLVEQCRRLFEAGDQFVEAVRDCRAAVAVPGTSRAQLEETYWRMAISLLVLGQADEARAALDTLLAVNPSFDPGSIPPRLKKELDAGRQRRPTSEALSIVTTSAVVTGRELRITSRIAGVVPPLAPVVRWRAGGDGQQRPLASVRDGEYAVTVTGPSPTVLEIAVVTPDGAIIQSRSVVATAEAPIAVAPTAAPAAKAPTADKMLEQARPSKKRGEESLVDRPRRRTGRGDRKSRSWYRNPWIWSAVGLSLAAGGGALLWAGSRGGYDDDVPTVTLP
jgi:hypothetical protein